MGGCSHRRQLRRQQRQHHHLRWHRHRHRFQPNRPVCGSGRGSQIQCGYRQQHHSIGGGTITISGGTVFAQSPDGAGIGDGQNNDGDTIDIAISGGTVEAVSTNGAGIGGGMIEALSAMVNFKKTYSGGEITISGGSVSAQSTNGAGIGSGAVIYDVEEVSERNTPEVNGGEITVSGGTVSAQSVRGAGIGGGSVTVGSMSRSIPLPRRPPVSPRTAATAAPSPSPAARSRPSAPRALVSAAAACLFARANPTMLTNIFIASAAQPAPLPPVRTGTLCSLPPEE